MSRFDVLIPHFNQILSKYSDLQKDDLINLVKINANESNDLPAVRVIDQISVLKDEHFIMVMNKIGVISKETIVFSMENKSDSMHTSDSNWECSVCTYSMSSKAIVCDMCGMQKDGEFSTTDASSDVGGGGAGGGGAGGGGGAVDEDWELSRKKKNKTEIIKSSSTSQYAASGGSGISSHDFSDTVSVISSGGMSSNTTNNKFQHTPISHKIYINGWSESDSPFLNGTENDFVEHFNNAMCRARETGLIDYVIGIERLPKVTSALLVFSGHMIASAAMHLNNKILWKNSYLKLMRPQGHIDEEINVAPLKMNVVIESPGIKLPPIIGIAERKKIAQTKMYDKMRKAESAINTNAVAAAAAAAAATAAGGGAISIAKKKITAVIPEMTSEQKALVNSLKLNLKKSPMYCLQILCSHDGRETSVFFEALAELCQVLNDHGIISSVVKDGKKLIVKDTKQNGNSYTIDKRAVGPVLLHSIADVRSLLRDINFPEHAFT
jgi:hypothetical protein